MRNDTLQDYICRDCCARVVVSTTATAFRGPCAQCGCWTFEVRPHIDPVRYNPESIRGVEGE